MKTFKNYLAFMAVFAMLFTSCTKEETPVIDDPVAKDAAVLSFGPVLNDMLNKSVLTKQQEEDFIPECSDDAPAFAQISLDYGNPATTVDVIVEILSDDNGLFTAYDDALEIPIPSGATSVSVTLNTFAVWNDDGGSPGEVIWLAPKTGSDYAEFVSQSLPFSWDLRAGSKTYTNVDVICFDDRDVNLYGYQFFDITPVELYEFCVFANYCTPSGRHYTGNYTFDVTYIGDGKNIPIKMDLMPNTGNTEEDNSGEWYADPLCVMIPGPSYGEDDDAPYIRVTATLADWPGSYGTANPDIAPITADLSWNQVQSFFDSDNGINYWHIFFGCEVEECDPEIDADCDGVPDGDDNCENTPNNDQTNSDGDTYGDVCDNCPNVDNQDQANNDDDSLGNACDNCPDATNEDQADYDNDGVGDVCDNCPMVDNQDQANNDDDSLGNACDNCPDATNEDQADYDNDGIGDVCDPCPYLHKDILDTDGDCLPDGDDPCPNDPENNCDEEECDELQSCETARMYGNHTFVTDDDELSIGSLWGWAEKMTGEDGEYKFPFWAAAGQNDTSKGYLVGYVYVNVDGSDVEVSIDVCEDVELNVSHIYISNDKPTKTAPGSYGNTDDNPEDEKMYNFTIDGDFWLIVHAEVCPGDD